MAKLTRSLSVTLFVLLLLLSGCIVTYRDFPVSHSNVENHERHASFPCHQTIAFTYGMTEDNYLSAWGGTYQWTAYGILSPPSVARAIEDALHQATGCSSDALYTTWPRTEIMVRVQEKPYPWHWYGELLGRISSVTYFVLPFYINEGGWEFSYHVYHDGQLPKTYVYAITARQFYWALLIPFSWVNAITYSLQDAVESTTAQFVADARRDGHL